MNPINFKDITINLDLIERNREIFILREMGHKLEYLAARFNLSPGRVWQIHKAMKLF